MLKASATSSLHQEGPHMDLFSKFESHARLPHYASLSFQEQPPAPFSVLTLHLIYLPLSFLLLPHHVVSKSMNVVCVHCFDTHQPPFCIVKS
jgi:hypothetical protein